MKEIKFPLVGQRFKEALTDNHMSQQELAEKVGVGKSSISQYCNGTNCPARDRAEAIGRILHVNPAWLMGFEAEKDNNVVLLMEQFKALPPKDQETFKRLMAYAIKMQDIQEDKKDEIP